MNPLLHPTQIIRRKKENKEEGVEKTSLLFHYEMINVEHGEGYPARFHFESIHTP